MAVKNRKIESIPGTGRLEELNARIVRCRRCPRLVAWREQVAREKRAAYADWTYWRRPLPGFGDRSAWLLIVGLAPAAHGANRTGRMFTGDRSGDFLYSALHRAGLASQAEARSADDGLKLTGAYVTAVVRCAPPGNRPAPEERANCREYLEAELDTLTGVRVVLALGSYAFDQTLRILRERGHALPRPKPRFAHGVVVKPSDAPVVVGAYHPSQQNTFTGRLMPAMFDRVLSKVHGLARV